MKRLIPWAILALSLLYVAAPMVRPVQSSRGFDLAAFARLPVFIDGRVQPIGSAARSALLRIRGTTGVALEDGRALDATEWLLEVLSNPYVADQRTIFPVQDPALRRELETAPVVAASPPTYYSFRQVASRLEEIRNRAERISELRPEDRSPTERELMTLLDALIFYQRLKNSLQPNTILQLQSGGKPLNYDLTAGVSRHRNAVAAGAAALKARERGAEFDRNALTAMMDFLQPFETVARVGLLLFIPPANPAGAPDGWENMGTALRASVHTGDVRPPLMFWAAISTAFAQGAAAPFNQQVSEYRAWLTENGLQSALRTSAFEGFYTRLQPSTRAAAVYLLAFLLGCAFWATRSTTLYRSAVMLCVFALALHTADVVIRGILVGRPPLANGYSSTVFAAWGAVVLGIAIEASRRNGIGVMSATLAGVLALVVGRALTPSGDAMEAIRATLNSNLWLTGHVSLMALGYGTVFLAGFVAAAYILLGVCTRLVSPTAAGEMDRLVYRLLRAAALLIAAGIMAGGFWADRVWGRFWGWDPKENGALLVILWTGIYLHARRYRLAEARTRMMLAVGGPLIATISWIGVNMMSVGLHSYGFMPPKFGWLALLLVSQLVVLSVGLLPLPYWRSSREPRSASALDGRTWPPTVVQPPMPQLAVASAFGQERSTPGA